MHYAVQFLWPNSAIIGCRFHLTQLRFKKIQKLGLSSEYKVNNWLKHTFGSLELEIFENNFL